MNGSMTEIPVAGGATFPGYLAAPASLRGPGLLVLADIYNMTPYIKNVADDFAAEGYLALVPDLFWRIRPGIGLAWGDPGRAEGRAYSDQIDIDRLVGDLDAAASFLRAHGGSTGRVGCMGFCLGGRLACLLAARTGIDAAVGYYRSTSTSIWPRSRPPPAPSSSISVLWTAASPSIWSIGCGPPPGIGRTSPSMSMTGPDTASAARTSRPTTQTPPAWRISEPSTSCGTPLDPPHEAIEEIAARGLS